MTELIESIKSPWTLILLPLIFGLAPGFTLRLIVRIYPKCDSRRRELVNELYITPDWKRPIWLAQQLETALSDGLPERIRIRRERQQTQTQALANFPTFRNRAFLFESGRPGCCIVEFVDLTGIRRTVAFGSIEGVNSLPQERLVSIILDGCPVPISTGYSRSTNFNEVENFNPRHKRKQQ